MDAFLAAARWQPGVEADLTVRETLPYAYVAGIVQAARPVRLGADGGLPAAADQRDAMLAPGLLCLALGVAEWGLAAPPDRLADPQDDAWKGAPNKRGKHLNSVPDGGIGLAHYDVGDLAALLDATLNLQPEIGTADVRTRIAALAKRFAVGLVYKHLDPRQQGTHTQAKDWDALVAFCGAAVQRRDVQHWMLARWLDRYWVPSIRAVLSAGGDMAEVLVNARIRNSSPVVARCAIQHAHGKTDRITAELDAYVDQSICPNANPDHKRRFGYMRRPVTVWNHR